MVKTQFEDEKQSSKVLKIAIEIIKDRALNPNSDRLNIAHLAKKCEVSRAWIYKNFGATNEKIILTAIDILAPSLTASIRPMDVWKTQSKSVWMVEFMQSLELTLEQVEADPSIFQFYINHRLQPTAIGQHLAHHESRFISHVVRRHVELSDQKLDIKATTVMAEYLAAIRTGLIFKWLSAPHLTLDQKRSELRGLAHQLVHQV